MNHLGFMGPDHPSSIRRMGDWWAIAICIKNHGKPRKAVGNPKPIFLGFEHVNSHVWGKKGVNNLNCCCILLYIYINIIVVFFGLNLFGEAFLIWRKRIMEGWKLTSTAEKKHQIWDSDDVFRCGWRLGWVFYWKRRSVFSWTSKCQI